MDTVENIQSKLIEAESDLDLIKIIIGEFNSHYCDLEFVIDCFYDYRVSKKFSDNNNYVVETSILCKNNKINLADKVCINFFRSMVKKLTGIVLTFKNATIINLKEWIDLLGAYEFEENLIEAEGGIELAFSKFKNQRIRGVSLYSPDVESYHGESSLPNLLYYNIGIYFK